MDTEDLFDPRETRPHVNEAIQWRDIDLTLKCVPQLNDVAIYWIKLCVGYEPEPFSYIPYLAFIQALTDNLDKGLISEDAFIKEIVFYCTQIRNDDMKKGGWVIDGAYGSEDKKYYDTILDFYKDAARARLCKFLGYEPDLKYSMAAEVYLRQLFQLDDFHANFRFCDVDLKAAAIVRYREAFIIEGEEVADDTELIGVYYLDRLKSYEERFTNRKKNKS